MAAAVVASRKQRQRFNHVDSKLLDACLHFLPSEEDWVHSGILDKLVVGADLEEWKPRHFVLTRDTLLVARACEKVVIDQVPLGEVVFTRVVADGPCNSEEPRKKKKKATMSPDSRRPSVEDLVDGDDIGQHNRLEIKTEEDGFNGGRTYVLRAESPETRDKWVEMISAAIESKPERNKNTLCELKNWLKVKYDSKPVQGFVAAMILANFACSIINAQLNPEEGSAVYHLLEGLDYFFTVFFSIEVAVNMAGNWFHDFFAGEGCGWNIFDLVVVVVSLMTIPLDHLPGLSNLRLMRVLRVVRLFEQLESLRKVVSALTSAIIPVANAFVVLSVITGIYAVVGVSMFREQDAPNFGSFADSIFTMIQVLTGDGWASSIARPLIEEGSPKFSVSMFFISYILIAGTFLFNVVIAVLLDEFITAVAKDKERCIRKADDEALEEVMRKGGALDPFLLNLSDCRTQKELTERINTVYKVLDCDDSGGLSFAELKKGLRKLRLRPQIHFGEEDFDAVTEHGALCNADGELDLKAFDRIVRAQLKVFMDKQLAIRMSNIQGDMYQSSVLYTLRHILMVLDDGLTVTKDTLTGGHKSLLPRSDSCPINGVRPTASDGSGSAYFATMPRTRSGNPLGDGASLEERLSGIEQSLQALLRRPSPLPTAEPSSPPTQPPPPRPVSLGSHPIQLSSRSPPVQLSSRTPRHDSPGDRKNGTGCNPSVLALSSSTRRLLPTEDTGPVTDLASPPSSPKPAPASDLLAFNDASLSDEAVSRLPNDYGTVAASPSPTRHSVAAEGKVSPIGAAKASSVVRKRRAGHHQRLRIAGGQRTAERVEGGRAEGGRGDRSSSPGQAAARQGSGGEHKAAPSEVARQGEVGRGPALSPRLWPTRVWSTLDLPAAPRCEGCDRCWRGFVRVGCLVSGQTTAMVTELGPLSHTLPVGAAAGAGSRADADQTRDDQKLAEVAETLLTRGAGESALAWMDRGKFVDTPTGDGLHLMRCYIKADNDPGPRARDTEAGSQAKLWLGTDAGAGSRSCFGGF